MLQITEYINQRNPSYDNIISHSVNGLWLSINLKLQKLVIVNYGFRV